MITADSPPRPRSALKIIGLIVAAVVLFAGFMALGTWQVHRLSWKLDLIARVDARVHAPPAAAPGKAGWAQVSTKHSEYRHVRVMGHYLPDKQTFVHTSTDEGRGYWVMAPLQTQRGFVVLINRGFVAANQLGAPGAPVPASTHQVTITGLLRISQPGGGFLRPNEPQHNRWYSRDVAAIAKADGLSADHVAPYFIDADADSEPGQPPVGGLTVVHFRNAHLVYAITWYGLALLVAIAAVLVTRYELRNRRAWATHSR